jgi:mRNA-degrading endonuclease RelE of RelBE toxin-antitoxin system
LSLASRDLRLARRLVLAMQGFARGERVDIKKLSGRDEAWRIRVGDWRLFLTLDGRDAVVDSLDNRRDAY